MSSVLDLRPWLEGWPYDPDQTVRIVRGDDGREILQVRTPLGLEQYELEGRPDGQRPHGAASALDHHLGRLERAKAAGEGTSFALGADDCAELFTEGTLYYYRYLHLFQLEEWPRTARDTARNLRLFDFVHRHAERAEDRVYLEKWRPYLIRMNAIAVAMLEVRRGAHDPALTAVDRAIRRIEALDEPDDETFHYERERSLTALRELAKQIRHVRPKSELERLEHALRRAVETQAFERAAELRDRIRALRQTGTPS
jgi:hypothetical protein